MILTQTSIKEVLDYNPLTGEFRWRKTVSRTRAGSVAGKPTKNGYRVIGIGRRHFLSHRLAWLYVHGKWPREQIDHINGNRSDNRIENLREASHSENCQHLRAARRDNKSCGLLGATWCKRDKRWLAGITVNNKRKYIGSFGSAQEAHHAYLAAKAKLHPFSAEARLN